MFFLTHEERMSRVVLKREGLVKQFCSPERIAVPYQVTPRYFFHFCRINMTGHSVLGFSLYFNLQIERHTLDKTKIMLSDSSWNSSDCDYIETSSSSMSPMAMSSSEDVSLASFTPASKSLASIISNELEDNIDDYLRSEARSAMHGDHLGK